MRASSLSYNTIAINREIDSRYDIIKEVSEHLDEIAEALSSASTASTAASSATVSAATASTKASEASASVTASASNASAALTSKNAAAASEASALTYKNSASTSATTATTKASEASTSAAAALVSETNANTSKNSAATSATTATTKASEASASATTASVSATNAASSASSALTSATTASTKAGEASSSASDALSYKNQAETFKNNASTSATKASQWADNNYNVEVEAGKYSAKHWSTVAQNATVNKIDKVTSTDNAIVRFDGATGQVQNSSVIINDNGNVGIGTSNPANALDVVGTAPNSAGIVSVRPNGAGTLGIVQARNSSDATNFSFGQIVARANKITIDSSKSGTGVYLPLILTTEGRDAFMIDTIGNSLHINPSGALGYGTGAGGTVTQLTSKSTGVTLNKPTGIIITSNSALAGGAIAAFLVNNSLVSTTDTVKLSFCYDGVADYSAHNIWEIVNQTNGSFYIVIKNVTPSTSFSQALHINFTVIKGANS